MPAVQKYMLLITKMLNIVKDVEICLTESQSKDGMCRDLTAHLNARVQDIIVLVIYGRTSASGNTFSSIRPTNQQHQQLFDFLDITRTLMKGIAAIDYDAELAHEHQEREMREG